MVPELLVVQQEPELDWVKEHLLPMLSEDWLAMMSERLLGLR